MFLMDVLFAVLVLGIVFVVITVGIPLVAHGIVKLVGAERRVLRGTGEDLEHAGESVDERLARLVREREQLDDRDWRRRYGQR